MKYINSTVLALLISVFVETSTMGQTIDPVLVETARQWETGEVCNRALNKNDIHFEVITYNKYQKYQTPPRIAQALEYMTAKDRYTWHYAQLLVMRTEICVTRNKKNHATNK
jgi:hypothetical protein